MNKEFARKIADDAKDAHAAELLRVPKPSVDCAEDLVAHESSEANNEPRAEKEIP